MLNTRKFHSIVEFFGLNRPINYFILYNDSNYINGYHGYEHMKRTLCSVFELSRYHKLSFKDTFCLLMASIFHDFSYLGTDKSIKDYDRYNIEVAIDKFKEYLKIDNIQDETITNSIVKLISDSEYPKCMNMIRDNKIDRLSEIFINADHSMVLFENYYLHQLLYYVLDSNGEPELSKFKEAVDSWFEVCSFSISPYKETWEREKYDIKQESYNSILSIYKEHLDDESAFKLIYMNIKEGRSECVKSLFNKCGYTLI